MFYGIVLLVLIGLLVVAVLVALVGYVVQVVRRPAKTGTPASTPDHAQGEKPQAAPADTSATDPPPTG